MIGLAAALPADLKQADNFDHVVLALGHADGGPAFTTLIGLAAEIHGLETTHYYPGALAHIGSLEASNHLVSLSFDLQRTNISGHRWFSLANALSAMLRKHPLAKKEFLVRVTEDRDSLAPIHARVLTEIIEQKDLLSLLQHCDPEGSDPLSEVLEHGVKELTMIRRPIDGTDANELEPSDLSWLRTELFRIYLKQEPLSSFAAKLLSIIDRQRDVHGPSLSERRHPDVTSGAPWPAAAAEIVLERIAPPIVNGVCARTPRPAKVGRPPAKAINGKMLRKLRGELKQKDFANRCGISVDVLQTAEIKGRATDVSIQKICRGAKAIGLQIKAEALKKIVPPKPPK